MVFGSNNKRYYWLRFQKDFFTSLRIKSLRSLAGGDTYTIIYLKMQLLSLENNGVLYYKGICKSFSEELAMDIDEKPENVLITVQYLLRTGLLVEIENDTYELPYTKANIGSETASTIRSRDCRAKKVLQCNSDATLLQQSCNGDIDKEKDIEIDIDDDDKYIERINIIKDLFQNVILDERLSDEVDTKLLSEKVNGSGYLKHFEKLTISWLNKNYLEIVADKYKDFATNRQTPDFSSRNYSTEEMNNVFDSLDDINV